ncbi:GbsR/MarR family transcriptional regulator [Niabella hibiscisoli]|uniref:GbsR/MarR family transcriptional regulator n=1 Tax=Niabella hibiscisoli TaxID=1825928 RepID=UPI001F114E5B|nr:ArsR family transcriptional regulator [Niabella hibiscisoli]MCH5721268.1 ArsR family transcriptional regulator [Niabella hibiscisoli]
MSAVEQSKQKFIDTWGALGSDWGINKSVAQVQALLLVSDKALSTDDIMEALKISRGNANMSLRQLMDYGIIYKKVMAGERKEFFIAEKDVWKWALRIAMMRKQKEINPVLSILKDLKDDTRGDKTTEGKAFNKMVGEIQSFTDQISTMADKVFESNRGELLLKLLKVIM